MKRKYLIITSLICLFMFTLSVNADNSIVCDSEVTAGSNFNCTATIDSEEAVIKSNKGLTINAIDGVNNYIMDGGVQANIKSKSNITFATSEDMSEETVTIFVMVTDESGNTSESAKANVKIKAASQQTTTSSENTKSEETSKQTTSTTKTTSKSTTKAKSSNNYLSTITIDGDKINGFSKSTQKYTISVSNDVNSIALDAKAENSGAAIDIDGPALLKEGENEYTLTVTAEDETTKVYKVIVIKEEKDSISTKLKNIKVSGYELGFDGSSKTFYLKVKNDVTKLNIITTPENSNVDVAITGNEDLKDGSIIKIVVSNEDEKTTYRIIIEKEDEKTNIIPYVIMGGIALIIILVIIVIVIKKKKNKDPKSKDNKKKTNEIKTPENTKKINKITNDDEFNIEDEVIDNDEEEKTRVLNFKEVFEEDEEDLEKTKILTSLDDEELD